MKLIINISQEDYINIVNDKIYCPRNLTNLEWKIANGIPLDKIKAEIEELDRYFDNDYFSSNNDPMYKCNEVLQIIDKYKAKSEG